MSAFGRYCCKVFLGWRTKILRAADALYARQREGPYRFIQNRSRTSAVALVSTAAAFTVVATTVVYAQEWQSASVLPLSELRQSALPQRVPITALPPRSVVHTATIIMPPTTAAYPRHNDCHTDGHQSSRSTRSVKDQAPNSQSKTGRRRLGTAKMSVRNWRSAGSNCGPAVRLQSCSLVRDH